MSQVLSHPSIRNGWFYEENENWAGQALALRVDKVLHVSKSEFQDVCCSDFSHCFLC